MTRRSNRERRRKERNCKESLMLNDNNLMDRTELHGEEIRIKKKQRIEATVNNNMSMC
jgi:hypothetical protein